MMSRPGIVRIIRELYRLRARDKIARVPRVLATDYQAYSTQEARIMARYGIRSPSGLKRAMRACGVESIDDLAAVLEHHRTRRRPLYKLMLMFRRSRGGTPYDPHQHEIKRAFRARSINPVVEARKKALKNALDHPNL